MKKPQIITMMDKSAAKINIIRLSPKPSPLIISACSALMVNVVLSPADKSPTSLPTDVKKARIIVTFFVTSHSAIPSRINIRRIDSNRSSSLTSTLSEQKPITKNKTTKDDPTATKVGSISIMTFHGPPPLKVVGDWPSSAKIMPI